MHFAPIWHLGFKKEDEQKYQIELASSCLISVMQCHNHVGRRTSNDTLPYRQRSRRTAPPRKSQTNFQLELWLKRRKRPVRRSFREAAAGLLPKSRERCRTGQSAFKSSTNPDLDSGIANWYLLPQFTEWLPVKFPLYSTGQTSGNTVNNETSRSPLDVLLHSPTRNLPTHHNNNNNTLF